MSRTALALACALALGIAGCGERRPQLAPIERTELHRFVDRARSAARDGDLTATDAALEALRERVRELRAGGRMDRETADELLKYSAVAQLRARQTLAPQPGAAG
jgi:ribosomal protein L19E